MFRAEELLRRNYKSTCSELKNFYVAITRARVQLLITESAETTATIEPFYKLGLMVDISSRLVVERWMNWDCTTTSGSVTLGRVDSKAHHSSVNLSFVSILSLTYFITIA